MQKVSLTIRVDAEDLERWKAKSSGNLSEWIRYHLNNAEQIEQGRIVRGDTPVEAPRGRHRGGARSRHSAAVKRDSDSGAKVSSAGNLHSTEHSPAEPRVSAEAACPHRKRAGEVCYKCDPKFGYPVIE